MSLDHLSAPKPPLDASKFNELVAKMNLALAEQSSIETPSDDLYVANDSGVTKVHEDEKSMFYQSPVASLIEEIFTDYGEDIVGQVLSAAKVAYDAGKGNA